MRPDTTAALGSWSMMKLRTFLSSRHAHALERTGLLDDEVADPLLEERMVRIRAQLTAALSLHGKLAEMGFEIDISKIDLAPLVKKAEEIEILSRREAKVMMAINRDANEAKHVLNFIARA